MNQVIKFGTDGWRAVIADDFTFANLERVALATARYFKRHKKVKNGIVIGYDARFMSREFAEKVAEVMANAGIKVKLADSLVTTPMISLLTKLDNAAGGIVITASHNPAKYNGFKIKGDFGGPAHPEMVAKVERELGKVMKLKSIPVGKLSYAALARKGRIVPIAMKQRYLDDLVGKIDIDRIRRAKVKILFDAMYGAGQGVLTGLLPEITQMREVFNPSFGGANPEPIAQNLQELSRRVRAEGFDIGIATDGDADRLGAVDEQGNFVDSHQVFSLLLKYLVEQKHLTGEVVKTFSVTQMVDQQCAEYGLRMHETPIGFKYVCRLMTDRDILIGGEESGGLSVKGHIPERDGVFLGLMLCEMMAVRGMRLSELVQELMRQYGRHEVRRVDVHLTEREKVAMMKKYAKGVKEFAGYAVTERKDLDGYKFFVNGGWVLVRASGTEPLIRFYAEAESAEKAESMLRSATQR